MPQRYDYTARDPRGRDVTGSVSASSQADALTQIARLGLTHAEVTTAAEPARDPTPGWTFDRAPVIEASRAFQEPFGRSLWRIVTGHWLIWLPPALLLWWRLSSGMAFRGIDVFVIGYAIGALLVLIAVAGPGWFYQRLLLARLQGRPASARIWLVLLSQVRRFSGLSSDDVLFERWRLMALGDRVRAAERQAVAHRPTLGDAAYFDGLAQAYESGGLWSQMIDARRRAVDVAQKEAADWARVDLAVALARFGDDAAQAAAALEDVAREPLSDVAKVGFDYARGRIAQRAGDFAQAVASYARAADVAREFLSSPIAQAVVADLGAYAAIALRAAGREADAEVLWHDAWPVAGRLPTGPLLKAEYETARNRAQAHSDETGQMSPSR